MPLFQTSKILEFQISKISCVAPSYNWRFSPKLHRKAAPQTKSWQSGKGCYFQAILGQETASLLQVWSSRAGNPAVKFQHQPLEGSGTTIPLPEANNAAAGISASEMSMVLHFLHPALSEQCLPQSKCCWGTEARKTDSAALAQKSNVPLCFTGSRHSKSLCKERE